MNNDMHSYHEQDYYALLEVDHDATAAEIEAAYKRLKNVFGESSSATYMLFGDDEADTLRQMLDEAQKTLLDAEERERYDDKLGIKRTTKSSAQPARSGMTSTTTPIISASIVEDLPPTEMQLQHEQHEQPAAQEVSIKRDNPIVSERHDDDNMEYSGGVLMRVRESKAVTLEAISQRTKISLTHLRAIEANQYDKLPARVYVRGFVAQYAKFLALNTERVCASYLAIYDRFVQSKATP